MEVLLASDAIGVAGIFAAGVHFIFTSKADDFFVIVLNIQATLIN